MKTLRHIVVLMAVVFACAQCGKDIETPAPAPGPVVPEPSSEVTLTLNLSPDTKVRLDGEGVLEWEEGDVVMVNGKEYGVTLSSSDPRQATVTVKRDSLYIVAYPGRGNVVMTEDALHFKMDEVLPYVIGGFDKNSYPMLACSTSDELMLMELCTLLKIRVKGEGRKLTYLGISSVDGMPVSGAVSCSLEDVMNGDFDKFSVTDYFGPAGGYSMDILSEGGLHLSAEPACFYIPVPAMDYKDGLCVCLSDGTPGPGELIFIDSPDEVVEYDFADKYKMSVRIADDPGPTGVGLSLSGEPGRAVRYVALLKSQWEEYCSSVDFELYHADKWMSKQVKLDQSGKASVDLDEYVDLEVYGINAELGYVENEPNRRLFPEGEFVVLCTNYPYEEENPQFVTEDFVTAEARGEAPSVELEIIPGKLAHCRAYLDADISRDIIESWHAFIPETVYRKLAAEGFDDEEILVRKGKKLMGYTHDSYFYGDPRDLGFLYPDESYVCLFSAMSSGGKRAFDKVEYRSAAYPDPTARWTEVSSDAVLTWNIAPVEVFTISGIVVEKMEGRDFFRIKNLFTYESLPFLRDDMYLMELEGDYYLYIDATDPDNVYVDPYGNTQRFCYNPEFIDTELGNRSQASTYSGVFVVQNDNPDVLSPGTYTYDSESGVISMEDFTLTVSNGYDGYKLADGSARIVL